MNKIGSRRQPQESGAILLLVLVVLTLLFIFLVLCMLFVVQAIIANSFLKTDEVFFNSSCFKTGRMKPYDEQQPWHVCSTPAYGLHFGHL